MASMLRTHSRPQASTRSAVSHHASTRFRFSSERGTTRVSMSLGTQASPDGTILATNYEIVRHTRTLTDTSSPLGPNVCATVLPVRLLYTRESAEYLGPHPSVGLAGIVQAIRLKVRQCT